MIFRQLYENCLPSKGVFHQISSIKGCLSSKGILHQRSFSAKGSTNHQRLCSIQHQRVISIKVFLPWRLSIIKGCSPSKVLQTLSYSLIRSHLKVPPQCFPWGRRGWGWEVQLEVSQSNQLKWSWLDWNWAFKINLSVMLHMPTCVWLLSAKCVTS